MKITNSKTKNAAASTLLLNAICGILIASSNIAAANTDNLYKQHYSGEYWWIENNSRQWLNKACAQQHEQAGSIANVIVYSDLSKLPRNDGPCPPVVVATADPASPSPMSGNLHRQPNGGEYWWIVNNTRRWMSRACGQRHEQSGASPIVIAYSELETMPRDDGPCPAVATAPIDPVDPGPATEEDYRKNLARIRQSSVRNINHDNSPHRNTPMNQLVVENHLGPRSEYLAGAGGNPENAFPVIAGGQNRTACEFSHFAYDDPLVHPDKPGAAHLHMFFGNTDVNAYSTYNTLINSGSSTCNGQELNRTGYWAPAMFDGNGNVRIPERIVVYYKGEGLARGRAQPYPEGAAMVVNYNINAISFNAGGAQGKFSFVCSDQYSGASSPASNTIPNCDGDRFLKQYGVTDNPHVVLEMNVKFPQCWNGENPSNPDNFSIPNRGGWYYSNCQDHTTLTNLEYFINYRVELGEDTSGWYLSSDVDPMSYTRQVAGGSTVHADWWGGWHKDINQAWLDNCVNFRTDTPSGCGFGYLTNGGPDGRNPFPGPALKYRPQYTGPSSVPAERLFNELCETNRTYTKEEDAAYCKPSMHH